MCAPPRLGPALSTPVDAQHLKRRGGLGFRPAPVSDSLATAFGLPDAEGFHIQAIVPGSTFEALGTQPGDILRSINGTAMKNWGDLTEASAGLWEGDAVEAEVWRQSRGKGKAKRVVLKGNASGTAKEQSTGQYEIRYDEVAFEGGYLRTIHTIPRTPGPHPTLYFIPGYTCASVDNLSPIHPYRKLLDSIAGLGYAIYRIEKPGTGDGPSPCQCAETGFEKELTVFETGYRDLLKQKHVDTDNIFIFGHSMGGVEAPLIAANDEFQPRGVAVYGTVFQSWYEYIIAMLRFQEPRSGEDYIEFEADMAEYVQLLYHHYVLMEPLGKIVKNEKWKELLERDFALDAEGNILYRRSFFWKELAARPLSPAWAKMDAHVLSIYGGADFEVFNSFSMEEIVRIVNHYHPGKGTFKMLKGTDHSMIDVGSMDEGVALRGTPAYRGYLMEHFDYEVVTTLDDWMQKVINSAE